MGEEGARELVTGWRPSVRARRRLWTAAAAAACLVCLPAPTAAPAAEQSVSVELRAQASNGYRFGFGMEDGPGSDPAGFAFWKATERADAGEPGFSTESASYVARRSGSLHGRRLRATIGTFGAVDARFEQTGFKRRVLHHGRGCREIEVTRRGLFVGRIDFAGEGGYAEVHREKIRGRIDRFRISDGCLGPRVDQRARFAPKQLPDVSRGGRAPLLVSCGADPDSAFIAGRDSDAASVFASSNERSNGVRTLRFLVAIGDRDWFRTGPKLRRATVQPTFPAFSGSARYARGALTGDLRVSLPGLADLPLTPGDAVLGREDDVPIPDCYPFGD